MPGIDFQQVRTQIRIEHVLRLLNFEPVARKGDQWWGKCPLHESARSRPKTFSVNVAKNCYYCHSCRTHGDQIHLWATVANLSEYAAAIDLCHRLGYDVPWVYRW